MSARDYRPELTAIVETFERLGTFDKKGLTLAMGVHAAQYKEWKESLEGEGPIHPNQTTRDSIWSLMELERDYRLDGIEWALAQMTSAAADLKLAVEVRKRLRTELRRLDEGEPSASDALAEQIPGTLGQGKGQTRGA